MNRVEFATSDFDRFSLHDVRVHALAFQRLEQHGNLIFDIDYLAAWDCDANGRHSFLIVPATMTFLDVVDLKVSLDWGKSICQREPYGVFCCPSGALTINDFRRFAYTDPLYSQEPEPYFSYELDFSEPCGASISLGARNFTIIGRQNPVRSEQQTLDPCHRTLLIFGG